LEFDLKGLRRRLFPSLAVKLGIRVPLRGLLPAGEMWSAASGMFTTASQTVAQAQ